MPVMYGEVRSAVLPGIGAEGTNVAFRTTRDGSQIMVPWLQSLVFAGRCFGMHAGSVTTPIAGHAAIDADQPEASVYFATTGTTVMPISFRGAQETGATTLAQGGMMCAVSNINVAIGTSTAFTPFNLKMTSVGYTTAGAAAVAYTANGTDPLTAGNFLELARVSAVIDADAATSGIIPPTLYWSADGAVAPLVEDIGSLLFYGEAAANTLYASILWAEMPSTYFN